jgi:D-arabinose 1-dehydrogenase-like Zn-dependent alcohol dehydrogenase
MGFQTIAIARGKEKEPLARELGAHHYIDSNEQDPAQVLQAMGGADGIVATAASGKSMGPLVGGLAIRGKLVVVGASPEPIEINAIQLLFGARSILSQSVGTAIEEEDTLAFSGLQAIRPIIELAPLEKAPEAYARMMQNKARFRMVIEMGRK